MSEEQKTENQKSEDSRQKKKKELMFKLGELSALLEYEGELAYKLAEALDADRYFITISCQKKDKPDDQHDLQHYWLRHKYNTNDVVPGLKNLAADFIAKENPTAELPDKQGWH